MAWDQWHDEGGVTGKKTRSDGSKKNGGWETSGDTSGGWDATGSGGWDTSGTGWNKKRKVASRSTEKGNGFRPTANDPHGWATGDNRPTPNEPQEMLATEEGGPISEKLRLQVKTYNHRENEKMENRG